jgi:uncharacterized Tic20 family protein
MTRSEFLHHTIAIIFGVFVILGFLGIMLELDAIIPGMIKLIGTVVLIGLIIRVAISKK